MSIRFRAKQRGSSDDSKRPSDICKYEWILADGKERVMKLSTAKRRINKTLDELTQSVIDDWYANFKNGYIKGYTDARQGKAPMYAEAYKVADTPQDERSE